MNKLDMAHEYAMKCIGNPNVSVKTNNEIIAFAWQYADAMQAEADKRECKERTDVLLTKDKDGNCLHFHHEFGHKKCMDCGASLEEWQPDWSQAPSWANWWVAIANSKGEISGGWFFSKEPEIGKGDGVSVYYDGGDSTLTGSFGYQGNWQDSLRKRPQ